MTQISDNLTARREALGLEVTDVHAEMNRRGFDVAYSTVAGWFNGNRGVRNMEHLRALCAILQTDLNSLTGSDVEVVEDAVGVTIAREMADLSATQREAVLAIVRSMKERGG